VARIAATLYRRRYGIVFQDLMGVAATQVGAAGKTRAGGAVGRLELSLARQASAIAIVTEGYRPYLVGGGVDPKRIVRVYNWAEYTRPTETREFTRQRLGWAETFDIAAPLERRPRKHTKAARAGRCSTKPDEG